MVGASPSPASPSPGRQAAGEGRRSLHATAIAVEGRGLLIMGASGSGKSELAAGMIALGAGLISDDLVLLDREGDEIYAARPPSAPPLLELRGIGPVTVRDAGRQALRGVLRLEESFARLPEPDGAELLGCRLPLIRHPPRPALAAKALLWLTARNCDITEPWSP